MKEELQLQGWVGPWPGGPRNARGSVLDAEPRARWLLPCACCLASFRKLEVNVRNTSEVGGSLMKLYGA